MQPTPTAPRKTPAEAAASLNPDIHTPLQGNLDAPLASTEPTSGPAGSTYEDYKKKATDGIQSALDSGKQALDSGKKWLEEQDLTAKAKELPQKAKDLGTKAVDSFNGLTTTQKAVGIGLLAAGVAFLATRGSRKSKDGEYRKRPQRSPFDHQKPYDKDKSAEGYGQAGRRPWGSGRYSPASPATGKSRVSSGSGYTSQAGPGNGPRRDQGPASGSRYDVNTSGHQNPNNLDDLSSAF